MSVLLGLDIQKMFVLLCGLLLSDALVFAIRDVTDEENKNFGVYRNIGESKLTNELHQSDSKVLEDIVENTFDRETVSVNKRAVRSKRREHVANKHPDVGLNTVQLINRQLYEVEEHTDLQTRDGYLLTLHRIPKGKKKPVVKDKPVVFLMHGLLSSSADWVNMGSHSSLAYLLADLGYDVWMGNHRGNKWSRKHVQYNPDTDPMFWDFSFHEIGVIDVPTMIDYALNVTGKKNLYYIGHSQGTTVFWVMASMRPKYNDKIRIMISLSPVAYLAHLKTPLFQAMAAVGDAIEWALTLLGVNEFLPSNELQRVIGRTACRDEAVTQELCAVSLFTLSGWSSSQLNKTMIPVITSNAPSGASTRQLAHFGQLMRSGRFCQYDHGIIANLIKYGTIKPPNYEIELIRAPVALYYSVNDWISGEKDVNHLAIELPNVVTKKMLAEFNHIDFLFGMKARKLLYEPLAKLLEKY